MSDSPVKPALRRKPISPVTVPGAPTPLVTPAGSTPTPETEPMPRTVTFHVPGLPGPPAVTVLRAARIGEHHGERVLADGGARRHPRDVGADLEGLLRHRADRQEVDRERDGRATRRQQRVRIEAAQRIDGAAVVVAHAGGFGQ